jgi:hypothetical protein
VAGGEERLPGLQSRRCKQHHMRDQMVHPSQFILVQARFYLCLLKLAV